MKLLHLIARPIKWHFHPFQLPNTNQMDEGQRFGKAWIGKLQLSELKLFQSLVKLAFLEVADDTVCCYFLLVCQPSCCMNV